jgi:PPOX class probable F420-dependent enzyme
VVERLPPVLTGAERAFLLESRRILMCTVAPDGSPRPVPICFALVEPPNGGGERLYTPLDEKPKRVADPHLLARVRDIEARPEVTILADRWDEDWVRLAWLRLYGLATALEPAPEKGNSPAEHAGAVAALRARYPQYATHDLANRPLIRITITRAIHWGELG